MTLPKSYVTVRTALETLDPDGLTVAKVKAQLFKEEIKRFTIPMVNTESVDGGNAAAAFLGRRKKFVGKQTGNKANDRQRSEKDVDREVQSDKKVFQMKRWTFL